MTKKKLTYKSGAEILAIKDLQEEKVHVPEWKTHVIVRALTGAERDKFETDSVKMKGKKIEANMVNIRARLVAMSTIDEKGKRLFSDADAAELGNSNASALDRIFTVAQRLSGIARADVEELAGN